MTSAATALKVRHTIQGMLYRQKAVVISSSHVSASGMVVVTVATSPAAPALRWYCWISQACRRFHALDPRFQSTVSRPAVPAMTPIPPKRTTRARRLTSQGRTTRIAPRAEPEPSAELSRLAWRTAETTVPHVTCHTPVKMQIHTRLIQSG